MLIQNLLMKKGVHRSFLDNFILQNKGFAGTVYYKPAFSEVYSNFNSFMTEECKHGLILNYYFLNIFNSF